MAYRYVRYKQTSLEKNYRYEVLTEHDLGVTIDLINPDAYTPVPGAQLHPTDERLLEDDILAPQVRQDHFICNGVFHVMFFLLRR